MEPGRNGGGSHGCSSSYVRTGTQMRIRLFSPNAQSTAYRLESEEIMNLCLFFFFSSHTTFHHFVFLFVCVHVCAYVYVCMCGTHTRLSIPTRDGPRLVDSHPLSHSSTLDRSRVSQTNLELSDVSSCNPTFSGIPCVCLLMLELQAGSHAHQAFLWVPRVLNSGLHYGPAST